MGDPSFDLDTGRVGGLPLVNRYLERLQVAGLFDEHVPSDPRSKVPHARVLGVLVRNLVMSRVPLYGLGEWVEDWVPALVGLESAGEARLLNDDRVGRSLDALFDADRVAMLTVLVVGAVREFEVDVSQLHNDSTSLTLHGEYDGATGQLVRGQPTLQVAHGHNKDHRPDLKQLLWILTTSADGAVPVLFKIADGGTEDSTTHCETWRMLCKIVGSTDFLYVADSKLCTRANLRLIHEEGGRFITVLPRTRKEDEQFRDWLQSNQPPWEEIARKPHLRLKDGPPDVIHACSSPIPDSDGYRVLWYRSSHKLERDARTRRNAVEAAWKDLRELKARVEGARSRFKSVATVSQAAEKALEKRGAKRWITYEVEEYDEERYRQEKRGRPGKDTRWRRTKKKRFRLNWTLNQERVDYDARCDGIFPLITNCQASTPLEVLDAYRSKQPYLEKRHHLLKNVQSATPVYLKSASRIEALFFLFFVALLVVALIERDVRREMEKRGLEHLPLYPEKCKCSAPSVKRILDVFEPLQRHVLSKAGVVVQRFEPELTKLQRQLLSMVGVSPQAFCGL